MAKQLNVNLVFNANTTNAKAQMKDLQRQISELQSLLNKNISVHGLTSELSKAQTAVASLKTNLNSAFDVDTGKLDLTRFSQSLKNSGMNLKQYRDTLVNLGPQGQQAFSQLTNSIVQGQLPLQKTNSLLNSMMATLGNTLRWQIASRAIMGVTSGVQQAFEYAQDLNESLNNIRIVTGKSVEEMSRFAESANKAAKALGASTTAYTDAALIYYQQGLDGKAVEERAMATLKLANVTGQSAEEISQQLTAIWNNFYDGSKNLEYYADVLTALGAATASSSDEISQGLEKFAAVAETVGLSYEYATTALATITATTRQSADIVGTALKTLFARVQDLDLGKTLEDGTTLGQYSEALYKVGVNIKDSSGELKDMNLILDEMGSKWEYLEKAEQVALAKSVAGIRQYTQLIALMDNWDYFKQNLTVAETSEGTLTDQQEIWAESWEAAQNRVTASAEEMYKVLVNDEFFIDLNNLFAELLEGLTKFTKTIGGLKTLLPLVGGWMLQAFGPQTLTAITDFSKGLMGPSKAQQAEAVAMRKESLRLTSSMAGDSSLNTVQAQSQSAKETLKITESIEGIERKITSEELRQLQEQLNLNKALQEAVQLRAEELDLIEKTQSQNQMGATNLKSIMSSQAGSEHNQKWLNQAFKQIEQTSAAASNTQREAEKFADKVYKTPEARQKAAQSFQNKFNKMSSQGKLNSGIDETLLKEIASGNNKSVSAFNLLKAKIKETNFEQAQYNANVKTGQRVIAKYGQGIHNGSERMAEYIKNVTESAEATSKHETATTAYARSQRKAAASTRDTIKAAEEMKKAKPGEIFMGVVSGAAQMTAGINMAKSSFSTLFEMFEENNHTLGGWLSSLSGILFAIPMVVNGLSSMGKILKTVVIMEETHAAVISRKTKKHLVNIGVEKLSNKESDKGAKLSKAEAEATALEAVALKELNDEELKSLGLQRVYDKNDKFRGIGRIDKKGFNIKGGKQKVISQDANVQGLIKSGDIKTRGGNGTIPGKGLVDKGKTGIKDIGQFFKTNGATIGYAAAIAASIAVTTAGVVLMVDAFNKHNKAAEVAKKNAAAVKKEYEAIVEVTNKLNENIDKYQELSNKTDQLVKGTYEYKKALMESNQAALELIKSNKVLQKPSAYQVVNGEIVINEQAMKDAQEKQLQEQMSMAAVSSRAEMENKQANLNKQRVKTLRDVDSGSAGEYNEGAWWGIGGGAAGAGIGAAVGIIAGIAGSNFWNPVGWIAAAVGAAVAGTSAIIGATVGDATEKETDAIEHLTEQYEDNPDIFESKDALRSALGPEFSGMTDALWENKDSIEDLVASNYELKLQEELLAQQIADAIVSERGVEDSRQSDAVSEMVKQDILSEDTKKASDDLYGLIKGQDGLLEDLYNYLMKDEGKTVDLKANDKGKIMDSEGNATDTTQTAVAASVRSRLEQLYQENNTAAIKDIESLIEEGRGVNEKNEGKISAALSTIRITDEEYESYRSFINNWSNTLDQISEFTGQDNADAHSQLLKNMVSSKKDIDNADFSFMSRDQLAMLEANIQEFDSETQKIIQQGIKTFEEKRAEAKIEISAKFDNETIDLENRAKELAKQEITNADFDAFTNTIINTYHLAEEQAERVADANLKVKNGLTSLKETYKDFGKYLTEEHKGTLKYGQALSKIQTNLQDWLGTKLETDVIEANLPTIQQALGGNIEAIEKLKDLGSQQLVVDFDLPDTEETKTIKTILDLQNSDIEVGMRLDTTQAGQALKDLYQQMYESGLLDASQIKQSLEGLGYKVETETKTVKTYANWWSKLWGQYETSSVEMIDWDKVTYQGDLNDYGIDFMPENSETERERNKRLKDLEKELDRYHEINEILDDIQTKDEALAKIEERSFGAKKVAAMQARVKALEAQVQAYDRVIEEAKKYRDIDKASVEELGGIIDEKSGNIINFEEKQMEYITKLQNIANKDSDEYKKLHEEFELFNDYAAKFEESQNKYEKTLNEQIELTKQILDKELEVIEHKIEIKLEINSREIEKIERQLSRLDDAPYDSAKRMTLLQEKVNEEFENIDNNKNSIRDTLEKAGVSKEDIDSYMAGNSTGLVEKYDLDENVKSALTTYTDNIIESEQNIYDLSKKIPEVFSDAIASIHEDIASINEGLETQLGIVENYQNIIDLVGKEQLGITDEDIEAMEKLANDAAQVKVQNAKANMDLTRSTLETVRQNMETATGEELKYWQEREKELSKQLQEDTETFTSLWAEAIKTAYDTFSKQTERAIDDFSDAIAGANFGSMEELQEAYDRQVELSDRYVENYKQSYELSKLNRQINQDLTKTDNVKSQKVLRDLQKEIEGIQKSGKQLTDYELNALQKKYDLKLAEIALEDTQNAKSTVRLRRDSEGNFGYVYTANQNEMDKAQQNYEDKLYSMQELNDNYLEEMQKSIISNRLEMVEELKALDALEIKDKKEYEKKKSAIIEKYTNNEKFMLGEMQKVFTSNQNIRDTDLAQYGTYQISYQNKTTDWITTFGNTTLGMKTGFDNVESFQKNLNDAIGDPNLGTGLLGEFDKAYKNLESNLDETFKQAGVDLGNFGKDNTSVLGPDGTAQTAFTSFKDHVNTAMYGENGVNASINSAKDTTKTLAKEGKEALIGKDGKGGLAKAVSDWYDEYGTKMKQGKTDAENLDDALTNLIGTYNIDININVNQEIAALTEALRKLREEIDKNKGIIKQQEQQIKDNQLETSELTDENSKYTIQAFGTYGGGYAAVQLNNGNWYGARGLGVNAVDNKVGDTITLRPGTTIDDYSIQTPDDYSNQETDDFVIANHKAAEDSSSWNPKAAGYEDNPYGGRQYKEWNGEVYIKAKTSDYWYKESELGKRKQEYKHGSSDKITVTYYFIQKGQQAYTSSFDTGGYTGSWGPEGRLAMLHQKEIVLNAHDTENLLTAVSMIREISDKLESNALAMRYLGAIGNYNAAINTNNHDTLQQEVTIHAEFPNATNHSEIEEAFGNLVNLASQYANRK